VTLLEKGGKRVWGHLAVEVSGLELLYSEGYRDEDHIETSYILFKEEFNTIYLLLRFHDELSKANKRKRLQEVKRAYHPSAPRLLVRKAKNVVNTCKDSILELLGLAMIGRSYDAILEKHIGKQVVLEITTVDGEVREYVGIFKDYTPQFLQVMDVSYLDSDQTRLCDITVPPSPCIYSPWS